MQLCVRIMWLARVEGCYPNNGESPGKDNGKLNGNWVYAYIYIHTHRIHVNPEVYSGMAVRPRGLGTPRRDMLAGEIYRSSLDAPQRGRKGSRSSSDCSSPF